MEIKRRLTKIAHTLSPQIEVMNVADEMKRMCSRMEELIAYAQEKIDRSFEKRETIGQKVARQRASEQKEIEDHQEAENAENLADQKEARRERQLRMMKSKKPEIVELEPIEVIADAEAEASRAERGVTVEVDMAYLEKEVKPPHVAKPAKKKKRRSSK